MKRDDRRRLGDGAVPGRVQAAERLVERGELADLRMIREERDEPVAPAEDVVDEPLERLLRADLDERPHALAPERLEAADPLHRRGDLRDEHVADLSRRLVGYSSPVTFATTGSCGGPMRRRSSSLAERLRGGRDDPGVERVAHRQADGLEAERAAALPSRARPPASSPPMTAWVSLLMFAVTT